MTRKSLKPLVLGIFVLGGSALTLATGFALNGGENNNNETKNQPLHVNVDSNPLPQDMKEGSSIAPIVKKVAPSVVKIFVTMKGTKNPLAVSEMDPLRRFFGED